MALVNVKDLVGVLNRVAPGLGVKENDIQANCFLFSKGRVYTYNDEVSVSCKLPKGMKEIKCVVQAKEFLQLLSKMKEEEINIEATKNELCLSSRRTKANFLIEEEIKMPVADIEIPKDFSELPSDFLYALKCCLPIVGKDMSKPLSTCIHLADNLAIVCDVDKAGRYVFDGDFFKKHIYLPGASAKVVSRFDVVDFAVGGGWIHFGCKDNTIVSARTYYDGQEMADFSHLLGQKGTVIELPKDLAGALERSGIFAEARTGTEGTLEDIYVELTIGDDWCVLNCDSSIGSYQEKVRVQYDGPRLVFSTSPELLLTALESNRKCEVCENFVKIYDDSFCHLVAVSRTTEKPAPSEGNVSEAADKDKVPF